jgi:hypothetical protein
VKIRCGKIVVVGVEKGIPYCQTKKGYYSITSKPLFLRRHLSFLADDIMELYYENYVLVFKFSDREQDNMTFISSIEAL